MMTELTFLGELSL